MHDVLFLNVTFLLHKSFDAIISGVGDGVVPLLLDIIAYVEVFHVKSESYEKLVARLVLAGVKNPECVFLHRVLDLPQLLTNNDFVTLGNRL